MLFFIQESSSFFGIPNAMETIVGADENNPCSSTMGVETNRWKSETPSSTKSRMTLKRQLSEEVI
jgi:hypothetical protein